MSKNNEKLEVEKQIDRYVAGQLSQEEIDELWVELVQHDEYMAYLETSANLKEITRDKQEKSAKGRPAWMYAAAAVVLLLLAVIGVMQYQNNTALGDIEPISQIEPDYYRSTDTNYTADDREKIIRKAVELYNNNQFDEAVAVLNTERERTTDVSWIAELDITIGTLFYNHDKFNNAAFYFADVINYEDNIELLTLEKAYWYLGNSYFQMDMLEEAEEAMIKAYKLNGAYSRVAKSYLDAMANVKNNRL